MIFMGDWSPKQGKDAIAQRLRNIPLIAMHGVHHHLQGRINDRSGFFGIKSFDERGGALEIRKQSRDRFALAIWSATRCQRRLFGPDALSQMLGRIARGSSTHSNRGSLDDCGSLSE